MWRKIEIKDHLNHLAKEAQIMECFSSCLMIGSASEGHEAVAKSAMYKKKNGNHLILYFTPETVKIFDGNLWGIQQCEIPTGAELHIGDLRHNPVNL
ncbi:hypothetical protein [Ochrobactrum sp. AN78]|jgi:hypothetical protein|uniref:hypothetical protein n=1 Tax=Ochrobactrum sp. AN78 TaxID=3039853 RepID=UPI002989F08B|nr:hypothetical protein [Ochrobactrum sp. AN78]MDH7790704.1 hypothetical protein [Ochrobactrum sp. AN78]